MQHIRHFIQRIIKPVAALEPGIYHYQSPSDAKTPLRLHLRIEPGGEGVLIVNASTVLRLNQTAAELAYHLVKGTPEEEIGDLISARYHIPAIAAQKDFSDFKQRLDSLVTTPDLDPVSFLGFERTDLYSSSILAPYRLDCALTYRLAGAAQPGLSPSDRAKNELSLDEWKTVLNKAWTAGIPHVIFTGGEATLRPDLFDLIRHTEQMGMVCGLLTDGLRLAEAGYLNQLLQSGLDHVMILLDPQNETCWNAVQETLAEDLSLTVHLTLSAENQALISSSLDRLAEMGLRSFSISAADPALWHEMADCRRLAAQKGLSLVWDLPVPYSSFHPVAIELAEDEPTSGAGRAWLYVEPDGDVTPSQGNSEVIGNFIADSWQSIWKKAVAYSTPVKEKA